MLDQYLHFFKIQLQQLSHFVFTPVLDGKNHCFTGQVRNVRHREFVVYLTGQIQNQSKVSCVQEARTSAHSHCLKVQSVAVQRYASKKPWHLLGEQEQKPLGAQLILNFFERRLKGDIHGMTLQFTFQKNLGNTYRISSGCTREVSLIRGCCHLSPLPSQTGLHSDGTLQLPIEHMDMSYDPGDSFLWPTSTFLLSWPPNLQCFFPRGYEFCCFSSKTY